METLLAAWRTTLPDATELGSRLIERWSEPWRLYHDTDHLAAVLTALDDLSDDVPLAVRLAAWYHDAIYDPRRDDSEERSAALAEAELPAVDVDPATTAEVARLVRLTATHDPRPDDASGALLCDADLAILGSSPDTYARYVADVRREYAHVPDMDFAPARAGILRRFLERDRIYRTVAARTRWEAAARRNIHAELDQH